jgi:alpha-amylase
MSGDAPDDGFPARDAGKRASLSGSNVCFGFEVHQPFRLNASFRAGKENIGSAPEEAYFSPENRSILTRVSEQCYLPATRLILDRLDDGFCCAFSLSGTVVEQLEAWAPDAFDLFVQVARHQNCELLCQTYYHSLACLFPDPGEFRDQVILHRNLMRERFGQCPSVLENTEFIFSRRVAEIADELGCSAVYTEGSAQLIGDRSPNYVYRCSEVPVLLRNCPLSDDIAFRFANPGWDKYPLTAENYAGWLALSPGDCVHVFLDYETFGEHLSPESGILTFLEDLPGACADAGVACRLPSDLAAVPPVGEIHPEGIVSWADLEKDSSAWLGNRLQQSAFRSLCTLARAAPDPSLWRKLQTSDHFYYIASKDGSCGEVHRHFGFQEHFEAFETYMRVVADCFTRSVAGNGCPERMWEIRPVPPEEAFHFTEDGRYAGWSAHGLRDLLAVLPAVPDGIVKSHLKRGEIGRWVRDLTSDTVFVKEIEECRDTAALFASLRARRDQWENE